MEVWRTCRHGAVEVWRLGGVEVVEVCRAWRYGGMEVVRSGGVEGV
jgi:hypothetical protein